MWSLLFGIIISELEQISICCMIIIRLIKIFVTFKINQSKAKTASAKYSFKKMIAHHLIKA